MKRPDPKRDPAGWRRYWDQQIAEAQEVTHAQVGDATYPRLAHGDDDPDASSKCHDCGCGLGQLHVPGCLVERCPRCKEGQACGCPCAEPGAEGLRGPEDLVH